MYVQIDIQHRQPGSYKRSRSLTTNPSLLSSPSSGLQGCRRFQSSAGNYSTMLLEADSERLYVGARGAVFALNASDISASSALAVSLFVSVLLHVVRLSCHIFNAATASFAFYNAGTFFEGTIFHFEAKVFIPLSPPVCLCMCVCSHFLHNNSQLYHMSISLHKLTY